MDELKALKADQLLFYIHGFSVLPEQAFDQAEKLQTLLGSHRSADDVSRREILEKS